MKKEQINFLNKCKRSGMTLEAFLKYYSDNEKFFDSSDQEIESYWFGINKGLCQENEEDLFLTNIKPMEIFISRDDAIQRYDQWN